LQPNGWTVKSAGYLRSITAFCVQCKHSTFIKWTLDTTVNIVMAVSIISIITSTKEVMWCLAFIYLSLCWFVSRITQKSYRRIWLKFSAEVRLGPA